MKFPDQDKVDNMPTPMPTSKETILKLSVRTVEASIAIFLHSSIIFIVNSLTGLTFSLYAIYGNPFQCHFA
jgi:hypothetical protein